MKNKIIWHIIISVVILFPLAACDSTTPKPSPTILFPTDTTVPTFTISPTAVDTLIPTDTPAPTGTPKLPCTIVDSAYAFILQPKTSRDTGWCEAEYSDFTITYPEEWALEAGGVWGQNRRFYIPLSSGQTIDIMALAQTTTQTIEDVDQTIMVWYDGDMVINDPVVSPRETTVERRVRTFDSNEVLVTTSHLDDKTIRRYYWINPQLLGRNKRMFLYFEMTLPTTEIGEAEYTRFLGTMEAVISKIRLTPTCADGFTRLHAGIYAQVTPGTLPNRVRSGPGKKDEIIAQLYPGTVVSVGKGPVCADGLVFWQVYNQNIPGSRGWMAEGDFNEYWLELYLPDN